MAKKKVTKKKAIKQALKQADIKVQLPTAMDFDEAMERIVRVPPPPPTDKKDIN